MKNNSNEYSTNQRVKWIDDRKNSIFLWSQIITMNLNLNLIQSRERAEINLMKNKMFKCSLWLIELNCMAVSN